MKTRIDDAGRLVVPKGLRDQIGLAPGLVDVFVEGARIVIEPIAQESFVERDGMWVIASVGEPVTDDIVRGLLDEGRK